jgi:hypothetical protein
MRKLEKSKTPECDLGFLVFPSFLLKNSSYLNEILIWRLTLGSLMVVGNAA